MLVGYASSSDEDEEPSGAAKQQDGGKGNAQAIVAEQNATESLVDQPSKQLGKVGIADEKVVEKKTDKRKKRGKKRSNKGHRQLPLLEEPVSIDSSDESGSDDKLLGYKQQNTKHLLNSSSLWGEDELELANSHNQALEDPQVGPSLGPTGFGSTNSYSNVPTSNNSAEQVKQSSMPHTEGEQEDVREMEKRLQKMLEEGRSIEEVTRAQSGGFIHVSKSEISRDVHLRREARRAQDELDEIQSSRITGTAAIDGRLVSSSMKRKNQLIATAYAAQELEVSGGRGASKRSKSS